MDLILALASLFFLFPGRSTTIVWAPVQNTNVDSYNNAYIDRDGY